MLVDLLILIYGVYKIVLFILFKLLPQSHNDDTLNIHSRYALCIHDINNIKCANICL